MIKETVTLYYKDSHSDKFYVLSIEQNDDGTYSTPVLWGRRGTSGTPGFKAQNVSYAEAKKAYDRKLKEELGKGYKPGEHMKTHAAGMSTPVESSAPIGSSVEDSLDNLDKVWDKKRKIDWKDGVEKESKGGYVPGKVSSGLLPQLLNEISEEQVEKYIVDSNYCAQEKHDGRRRMLRYISGKVDGINKKGQVVGYPAEFEGACKSIAGVNGLHDFILDGEEVGQTLYLFDLLSINGMDLRSRGYGARYREIGKQVWVSDSIQVVKTAFTSEEKRVLYNGLKRDGKEGIVFKLLYGTHKVGYSDDMRKFKFTATASVIITGHNKKNSISIGVMDGDKLVPVGNVTMIGHEKPSIGSICECRYLYYFPGGSLFQPRYLGIRDDVEAVDCTLSKLRCKSIEEV